MRGKVGSVKFVGATYRASGGLALLVMRSYRRSVGAPPALGYVIRGENFNSPSFFLL